VPVRGIAPTLIDQGPRGPCAMAQGADLLQQHRTGTLALGVSPARHTLRLSLVTAAS